MWICLKKKKICLKFSSKEQVCMVSTWLGKSGRHRHPNRSQCEVQRRKREWVSWYNKVPKISGKINLFVSHTSWYSFCSKPCKPVHALAEEGAPRGYIPNTKVPKGLSRKGLFFQKTLQRDVEAFTDADWAGSVTDQRSTTGYCTYVWGNLVTWRSKKQTVVARSSAKAEFRAMANGICELLWLQRVLEELKKPINLPMKLYCDNKAAISIA